MFLLSAFEASTYLNAIFPESVVLIYSKDKRLSYKNVRLFIYLAIK